MLRKAPTADAVLVQPSCVIRDFGQSHGVVTALADTRPAGQYKQVHDNPGAVGSGNTSTLMANRLSYTCI